MMRGLSSSTEAALQPLLTVWADPVLRTAAALMLLLGGVVCTLGPYVSVLAVDHFGLGDIGYAALMVVSTLLSVTTSVLVGIRSDQTSRRKVFAVWSAALVTAAMAIMTLLPVKGGFLLAHGLLLPLSSALFGQLFALSRQASSAYPVALGDGIMAVVRALFALPFVVILPLWAVAFARGAAVLSIYPVCLVLSAVMLVLTLRHWPVDGNAKWEDRPSGLSLRRALAELARPAITGRIMALGGVIAAATVYMAIVGLVLVPAVGRGPQDVALYVGLVAGLEVPFMLTLPALLRHLPRPPVILAGTAIYALHVALLPVLAGSPFVWLLVLPAAVGGAITLTLPIAYLQDLLADRPGTGASLMALQRLAGDVLAALCFTLGTVVAGYGLVALIATVASLIGAGLLVWADRRL